MKIKFHNELYLFHYPKPFFQSLQKETFQLKNSKNIEFHNICYETTFFTIKINPMPFYKPIFNFSNSSAGDEVPTNKRISSYSSVIEPIEPVISDFGLCCPTDQNSVDKTLYGVLPFVAPEILRGEEFTKAADIYGFGMLMSEVISGTFY